MSEANDWFSRFQIPIQPWIDHNFFWLSAYCRPYVEVIRGPLTGFVDAISTLLSSCPPSLILTTLFLVAWQVNGPLSAACVVAVLGFVGLLQVWNDMVLTFALVLTSVLLCVIVGLPLGFASARSDKLERALRPVLDLMQTLPAFVYLVPIVLLVGIGSVPGILVTFVFAVPPTIRLTRLGLRNVPAPMIEAAEALGASPGQVLFKVEIPNALRTILLGLNQTIMMALAMVTYAAMIGVGGLGRLVLQGIGRLDLGLATVGGLGIVALAVIFSELIVVKRRVRSGPAWAASPWALVMTLAGRRSRGTSGRAQAAITPFLGDENHAQGIPIRIPPHRVRDNTGVRLRRCRRCSRGPDGTTR